MVVSVKVSSNIERGTIINDITGFSDDVKRELILYTNDDVDFESKVAGNNGFPKDATRKVDDSFNKPLRSINTFDVRPRVSTSRHCQRTTYQYQSIIRSKSNWTKHP